MGNVTPVNTNSLPQHILLSSASGTGSTVANAAGKRLRIFFHKDEVKLEDLLENDGKRFTRPNAAIGFIDLPPKQHLEGPSMEEGYASILVADSEDAEVYVETISLNFQVPDGASCIVTATNEVKFRSSDGGIWVDEDGQDHST